MYDRRKANIIRNIVKFTVGLPFIVALTLGFLLCSIICFVIESDEDFISDIKMMWSFKSKYDG